MFIAQQNLVAGPLGSLPMVFAEFRQISILVIGKHGRLGESHTALPEVQVCRPLCLFFGLSQKVP